MYGGEEVGSVKSPGRLAESRIQSSLRWVNGRLSRTNLLALGAALGLIGLIKTGIGVFDSPLWPLASWPRPVEAYPPLTYGYRVMAWIAHTESRTAYTLIALISMALFIPAMAWLLGRSLPGDVGRFAVLIVLGGPSVWILWGGFGRTDVLVLLGGVMLGSVGRRLPWAVVAAALTVLGNPEQAVVLSLSLFMLSLNGNFKAWRRGALLALSLSACALISLTIWSRNLGIPSRLDYFPLLVRQSLHWFFNSLPLELYAGFGISLILIVWAILDQRILSGLLVAVSTLGLPLLVTATTLDQSRVLVCTSIASLTAVAVNYAPRVFAVLSARVRQPLAATLCLVLVIPAVEITADVIRVPWSYLYPYLVAYVLHS